MLILLSLGVNFNLTKAGDDFGLETTPTSWEKGFKVSVYRFLSGACVGVHEEMATRQAESGVDQEEQAHVLQASQLAAWD